MTGSAFDTSELRAFAAFLGEIPEELGRHAYPVVEKGAINIKKDMVDEAKTHRRFKAIAPSITYDMHQTSFGGRGAIEAEIGPVKERGNGKRRKDRKTGGDLVTFNESDYDSRRGGALANIAYFGSSITGGGTVEDPQKALEREMPRFERAVDDLLDKLL